MVSLPKTPRPLLSPLIISGAAFLTQTVLKKFSKTPNLNFDPPSQTDALFSSLFDPSDSSSQSVEAIESRVIDVLGDYLVFMLLSIIFHLMILLFIKVKGSKRCHLPTENNKLGSFEILPEHRQDQQEDFMKKLIQLIKPVLCYTLAFCFFKIALICAFAIFTPGKISPEFRILQQQQEGQEAIPLINLSQIPEKVSLAVGRVLASFDVQPISIKMSLDEKWAFVSTENPQLIRVYDTSDFRAPVQVAIVSLGETARSKMFLELSADETMLIASNYEDVKIIDVKNPRSPQVIGSFYSPMHYSSFVFVSMALSKDNKYLFMAEVGFAILDISNLSNITMVYSSVERSSDGTGTLISLSASSDRKLLYLANGEGALEVYNVTNPTVPALISKFSFEDSTATSVFLSKNDNLAYVAGIADKGIAINVVSVSNPLDIKQVSNFVVKTFRTSSPIIQALSPRETKLYIVQRDLMVVDLISMSEESNSENLVKKNDLLSLCFSAGGQYAGVAYREQIVFIELFVDYPNTKIFTPSNSTIASFVMNRRFDSWAMNYDGTALFAVFNDYKGLNTSFEIWNIKDKEAPPKKIVSLNGTQLGVNLTTPLLSFKMSPDHKRVYLKWWTSKASMLTILDVSGDLTAPKKLKEFYVNLSLNLEVFAFSKNEKILCMKPDGGGVMLYDLESPEQNIITLPFQSKLTFENFGLEFAKNDTVLMIISSKISIYNVSNLSNPKFIGSIAMTEGGSPQILSAKVLEKEDSLIVEWYQTSRKLRVYNLSEIMVPKLISELHLPKNSYEKKDVDVLFQFCGPFVYSENQKVGYAATSESLLRVDLSDLKNPVITGIVPVPACKGYGNSRFIISLDGNTAFATNQTGMLRLSDYLDDYTFLYNGDDLSSHVFAIDLQIKSTLYIPQEKILLGERFSDNVFILKSTENQRYQITPKSQYKVLKLYTFDIKVLPNKPTPQVTTSSLPDWMKFNIDTLSLTVESKSKRDLGAYTICSAVSTQVNKWPFYGIRPVNNTYTINEIFAVLMVQGYMDRDLYLTANFGTRDGFFLPERFDEIKDQIYDILTKYYVEACTKLEVIPSLNVVELSNKIQIETTRTEAIKIDITLLPDRGNNSNAHFLNKVYGPLNPDVRDQKSRIILEGTLNEVNSALQNVVINGGNKSYYDGIVSVNDGLNHPMVGKRISNISEYFLKNSPPFENPNVSKSFKEQLELVSVSTGQYFTIIWDENTFKDKYIETLHYEVIYDNDGNKDTPKGLPDWLTFSNLALRGTPPEKLTEREIPLKFIVKNEFQNITIPFKLNIEISSGFALSLLIKYSPMLLTALGFYIKANKIYNVICKKRYKHPKEYQVQVGQEISILPILFIKEEEKESKRIINHLLKYLKKKKKSELVSYFVDEESRIFDKAKIIENISQAVSDLSEKEKDRLPLYLDDKSAFNKKIIIQIVINQISMLRIRLPQEKPTKRAFDDIKAQWADLVEWNPELMFFVNKKRLSELLDKKNNLSLITEENSSQSLLLSEEVNQDLLQDILISHTFSHQSLDYRSTKVLVEMYERFKRNWLKVFLKKDLEGAHLNNKLGIDYGISCKMEHGILTFSGTPKENFTGRTLAIQIQTLKCRIVKEIWIQEKSAGKGNLAVIEPNVARTESSFRGNSYEIY